MTPEEYIYSQYRGKRVLLDANLLLLYFIGSYQRGLVESFKRTSKFSTLDFDLLAGLLDTFRTIVTTPHILTEVGNLANALQGHLKESWLNHFSLATANLQEIYEPATAIMRQPSFILLGLTDAAVQAASKDTLVLTEDFPLSGFLRSKGVAVLNFQELVVFSQ